jgi:glycosyltransferase involved in cell wall biosynthesis
MSKNRQSKVILLVTPVPIDGYPPTQNQAQLLAEAGFHVVVLTSRMRRFGGTVFNHSNVRCFRFPLNADNKIKRRLAELAYALTLIFIRLRFARRIAAEFAYEPKGIFFAGILPFRAGKWIMHFHEILFSGEDFHFNAYSLRAIHKANLVLVADKQRAVLLQKQAGLPINLKVVRNLPLRSSSSNTPVGDTGAFSVVYCGSISYCAHAFDTVIKSMGDWPPAVNFHIYGNPSNAERKALELLARQMGVFERLRFEGWVPTSHLIDRLQTHSVGISLLRPLNDNWRYSLGASNKRYQYMQAALPQVSDDLEPVVSLIERNRIGFCVSPDDPKALAAKINLFYQNELLRREYGQRAYELYRSELYYEKEFAPVLHFLEDGGTS